MTLFDCLMFPCATCGKDIEFRSTEGPCCMHRYTVEEAPTELLLDALNKPQICSTCGSWTTLVDPAFPPGPRPRPTLTAAATRSPSGSPYKGSKPSLRWWPGDRQFTYSDLVRETPSTLKTAKHTADFDTR